MTAEEADAKVLEKVRRRIVVANERGIPVNGRLVGSSQRLVFDRDSRDSDLTHVMPLRKATTENKREKRKERSKNDKATSDERQKGKRNQERVVGREHGRNTSTALCRERGLPDLVGW